MEIKIDIPEQFLNGKDSLVYIEKRGSFLFCRSDSRYHGSQSNFEDEERHKELELHLKNISDEVIQMIEEELI